ncbi:monocarboxylate transporter 12-like [Amphiura filiformis]|uniref:monocarboxylate transporter 12-like n=1 Tax=Amphiura filiformis TaxID=82378 RepID=UPI003B20C39A
MSGDTTDGSAWMVCLGTFIIMVLETGMVKSLGVLLPVLQQQFTTKTWMIGLMISLVPGIGVVTCPLAGALSKRFSARWTVIIFCIISSAGLIVGSLVSSVHMLSISFLFTGFGIGAEAIVVGELARYFNDNEFRKASAFARAGIAIGIIIMPLLTQFLNDVYGWRGTMLILGAINLHCVISGALLRPVSCNLQDVPKIQHHTSLQNTTKCGSEQQKTGLCSMISINIWYYLDLELFCDVIFLTRMVYSFGSGYLLTGWLIYLVPSAMDVGISSYKAAFLATLGGIGHLCGFIAFPVINNVLSNSVILYSASASNCLFLLLHPLSSARHSYVGMGISSAGLGVGRPLGLLAGYQIVKENIEQSRMTNAFMWFVVAHSLGTILSGFLSGWIYDKTGSYTISFVILSAAALLSVSLQPFADYKQLTKEATHYSPVPLKE